MQTNFVLPEGEPFFLPGGRTGCLLLHGFTSMPAEMRWLGEDLARRGCSVLGVRLAGHGTHPGDLARTRWTDWQVSVEEGLALLRSCTDRVVVIGLSLGAAVALTAAASYAMAGVVALSTPWAGPPPDVVRAARATGAGEQLIEKELDGQHSTLPDRLEPDYPAYPAFPLSILAELDGALRAMRAALPRVAVPVLLVHSRADEATPVVHVPKIEKRLKMAEKQVLLFDEMDHALVRDPQRELVFEAVGAFVARLSGSAG